MMNKKFLKTILFGGLFLSLTGAFVSCAEDYSDDIQNLQTQITTNSNAIAELQALLAKGVVITSVEKNAEGILLTLSDGSTQQLTNGADGKDGQNGADGKDGQDGQDGTNGENGKDADVWTIENGVWCLNGEPTEYKAVAEDGEDGVDGGFYRPNTKTGNFDYVVVVDGKEQVTDSGISWKSSSMVAVMDGTCVVLSGVEGYEGDVVISTVADLKSLVFVPQLIIDGVPAMKISAGLVHDRKVICTPQMQAVYHLNPTAVKKESIVEESLGFVMPSANGEVDYKKTRAIDAISAKYAGIADGKLTVNVDLVGTLATGNKIDLVALQVETAHGEIVTSDYATIDTAPYDTEDLIISRQSLISPLNGKYAHYWSIDEAKKVAIEDAAVNPTHNQDRRIITVKYDESINLYDYVSVCFDPSHTDFVEQMDDYHLSIKFSKVKFVPGGEGGLNKETDESEFITLGADGKVTPKTYEDGDNLRSAIGRTPIIKAELCHEGVSLGAKCTRYIVLEIVEEVAEVFPVYASYDVVPTDVFAGYDFCNGDEIEINAQDMNTVYSKEGVTKEEFAQNYTMLPAGTTTSQVEVIDVNKQKHLMRFSTSEGIELAENPGQIATFGLTWYLDHDYFYYNQGATPTAKVTFVKNDGSRYVVINITHKNAIKSLDILKFKDGNKFVEMWEGQEDVLGMFNVRVPYDGEKTTDQCTFINDIRTLYLENQDPVTLNTALVKNSIYGKTSEGVKALTVDYVFKAAKCDTLNYISTNFKIKNDGKELWYTDNHLIATLDGTIVTLNDNHDANTMAEELLNTNKLIVTYAVRAEFESCLRGTPTGTNIEKVPSDHEVTFDVRYVRPLNVLPTSEGYFEDGIDFGKTGTVIKASDVVRLQDWRGHRVIYSSTDDYYGYYGVEDAITVEKVTCNTKTGNNQPLPGTIRAGIVNQAAKDAAENSDIASVLKNYENYEYFYYYNNGTVLQEDIAINFVVTVKYWWGELKTRTVTVPVKATKRVNAPASK